MESAMLNGSVVSLYSENLALAVPCTITPILALSGVTGASVPQVLGAVLAAIEEARADALVEAV